MVVVVDQTHQGQNLYWLLAQDGRLALIDETVGFFLTRGPSLFGDLACGHRYSVEFSPTDGDRLTGKADQPHDVADGWTHVWSAWLTRPIEDTHIESLQRHKCRTEEPLSDNDTIPTGKSRIGY